MINLFKANKLLSIKCLLLSAIIHLSLIGIFVFSFPNIADSFKPKFVFLGSILQNEDISKITLNKNKSFVYQKNLYYKTIKTNNPYFNPNSTKPTPIIEKDIEKKKFLKSLFEIFSKSTSKDEIIKEMGIEPKMKPYQPLRLNAQ